VIELEDSTPHPVDQRLVVGRHEDGRPGPVDPVQEAHDALRGGWVEVAGGLVGEQDQRSVDECPSHRHTLVVEKGSLMERVYGESEIRVNSMHHMAVDAVAPGFAATARCPDGVVEAIESTMDDWFAMGVQFHPEEDRGTKLDICVFEQFMLGAVLNRRMRMVA